MAMAIDVTNYHDHHHHDESDYMEYYTHSTSTTTPTSSSDQDHAYIWEDGSPFCSMMELETLPGRNKESHDPTASMMEGFTRENSISDMLVQQGIAGGEDSKGLRLVHLLMAAAEAVNKNRELACVILVRLKELVSVSNGTNMERLAAYFTEALHGLLEGNNHHHYRPSDVIAGLQLLQDMSPYVKFGHFTANQAILEAVEQDKRIHIVDYDIMEGIQWASLMQALVSKNAGPSGPHLRITAISRTGSGARRSICTVQETGRRLVAFAASIGLPFSFHQCRLDSDGGFRPSSLMLVKGEALIMNCTLHLPHTSYRGSGSIASFLLGAKVLNPRLITLVEEEVGHIGPEGGFVGRFMDSLSHYSALFDSLEAGFPLQGWARALVERVFLGPQIVESLARIHRASGKEECGSWARRLVEEGFGPKSITFANRCQAMLLLGLYNDGYSVEQLCNSLVLSWKSRRLLSASIWNSPYNSDSN